MATEMQKSPDYRSIVQKTADAYIPLVQQHIGEAVDSYQVKCMQNALVVMNDVAQAAGVKDLSLFAKSDIMRIMQQVATLKLNAFSQPRECYFQTRKKKLPDGSWGQSIEMGIEGDGNDAILRNFGHGVKTVYPYWAVREGDDFTYPVYSGLDVTPPVWRPSGTGKYVRVVYPVEYTDGSVRYWIGERADVRINLVAHINNNMMNETFGIAKDRYHATLDEKKQIDARKAELKALMDGKDIDEILDIPELQPYISPAWREGSRETMILRKMRNNVVKKIPKDFASHEDADLFEAAENDRADTSITAQYTVVDDDLPADAPRAIEAPTDEPREAAEEPAPAADKPRVSRKAPAAPAAPF